MELANKQFLENRIRMIEQILNVAFTGESILEKESFYKQHEKHLNEATSNILTSMYDVYAGNVKVFQLNDCDWVAAKSIEEAVAFYLKTTGVQEEEALENPSEVKNLKTWMITLDFMDETHVLYNDFGHLQTKYLKDGTETFEVPAIEILFQEWNGEPYVFVSREY